MSPHRKRSLTPGVLALALALSLAACSARQIVPAPKPVDARTIPDAVPRDEPVSAAGNPPFYEVFGERYFVLQTRDGYVEQGVASWYGPKFHGGRTATGESFDMYAMTAAHKTLPLPSYARVTNLTNGKSVVVRINDRGPFAHNRLIDLSYAAAIKLDMIQAGTTLVEVEVVQTTETETSAPVSPPARSLYVQVGAFSELTNAERLRARLSERGMKRVVTRESLTDGRRLYRVQIGPIHSVEQFDRIIQRVRGLGIHDAHLAAD